MPTPSSRPMPRPATTAWPSSRTRPTGASATRSSLHELRSAVHDRRAACRTTGRPRPWPASRCALRAGASTTIPATAASTRSRTPARRADRGCSSWAIGRPLEHYAVRAAARRLADGALLAIKGIGGYHLACAAADDRAVGELRARKRREDRPFALMVRDATAAAALVELADLERDAARLRRSPDRARAAPSSRKRRRRGRPRRSRARRHAAVRAASPPPAR